ncbi:MAG: amidase [Bryobacterales bacterium]|nr:amidase [Bryobacterales bacterium]
MEKKWIGCAETNFRAGRPPGFQPEAIVIHIMDGTLAGTDNWFLNPRAKVSAHYGVGRKGEVHQYVAETDTAFHAGLAVNPSWALLKPGVNPNFYTIGIEHEGKADDEWEEAKLAASGALIAEIAGRRHIPLDRRHVIAHREIRASKTCPGFKVSLDDLIARAKATDVDLPVPAIVKVHTTSNVNLREQADVAARIVRVIPSGAEVVVTGFTDAGTRVKDNSFWYRDSEGFFFWAGATDVPNPAS